MNMSESEQTGSNSRKGELSPRSAAKIAGFGYLAIIILGIFAEFFVRSDLIVPGDASTTASNIIASEQLFRISIACDLIMLISDVVVALALYVLLKPVNRTLALLATFFRLVHSAIYGVALLNLSFVVLLLSGAGYLAVFDSDQINALVLLFLNGHSYGYVIGLVFFGFHCFFLGYLILKSDYIPRILGVLLIIASFGYLIDSFAKFVLPNYSDYETLFLIIVAVPAIIAELSLCLWLLFKGTKISEIKNG